MIRGKPLLGGASRLLIQSVTKRYLAPSSQKPKPELKHYRLWAVPGDLVLTKHILAKQHTMKWHPGLNVGIDHERTLYALRDGIMIITEEEFDPDWEHPLVEQVYMDKEGNKLAPPYKRYVHVIAKKRVPEFKLVDVV